MLLCEIACDCHTQSPFGRHEETCQQRWCCSEVVSKNLESVEETYHLADCLGENSAIGKLNKSKDLSTICCEKLANAEKSENNLRSNLEA